VLVPVLPGGGETNAVPAVTSTCEAKIPLGGGAAQVDSSGVGGFSSAAGAGYRRTKTKSGAPTPS
jgi:hypothetical protein